MTKLQIISKLWSIIFDLLLIIKGEICDIDIVKNIMGYLEDHMNELDELCTQCDWSGRQEEN